MKTWYPAPKEDIEETEKQLQQILDAKEPVPVPTGKTKRALHVAINAIRKQIPTKPHEYTDLYGFIRSGCPNCERNEILYVGQKYCSVCGQRIDWSDLE